MPQIDAGQLQTALGSIRDALAEVRRRPQASPPVLGADPDAASRALMAVVGAVQSVDRARQLGAGVRWDSSRSVEGSLEAALFGLHKDLVLDIKRSLGGEAGLSALGALLHDVSVPDFLTLAGIPTNEIAHSGLIRSLLDPRTSPAVAPQLLIGLVEALFESDDKQRSAWRSCVGVALQSEAGATSSVSVRTEVPVGEETEVQGRIDVLVSGPGFILAIENKTQSLEHDDQTRTYERWLNSKHRTTRRAGVYLTIEGAPAVSSMFRPFSYLRLLGLLLRASQCCSAASRQERALLGSYIKTLAGTLLAKQMTTLDR